MLAGKDSEFWGDNPTMKSDFGNNTIIGIGIGNTLRGGNDFTTGSNAGNNTITAQLGDIELAEGEASKNVLMGVLEMIPSMPVQVALGILSSAVTKAVVVITPSCSPPVNSSKRTLAALVSTPTLVLMLG